MNRDNKVDHLEKVKKIALDSGNNFHSKVVQNLRKNDWETIVSPHYSDNFTDKPREVDIIASKVESVIDFHKPICDVEARLLIECKYVTEETLFWFDKRDQEKSRNRVMDDVGISSHIDFASVQDHHYLKNDFVAKIFDSSKSTRGEYQGFYSAVNQVLNALIYYRYKSLHHKNFRHKTIPYPVIVINSFDKIFKTTIDDSPNGIESISEPFQLEVNYAFVDNQGKERLEYFLIDVVSLDKLNEFINENVLSDDIYKIKQYLLYQLG